MRKVLLFVALLVFMFSLVGCKAEVEVVESEDLIEEDIEISEEEDLAKYICSLTNLRIDEEEDTKLRPIAVMIDNEYNARPQSGLGEADIVYEIPVEGNITRYMGIYHHMPSEKIGPVRSARPYFIDKALEYGAIYVHCGGSPQALEDLQVLKVDTYNDLKGTPVFWRATDRKMPHNLYTSTKYMREVATEKKLENGKTIDYFKFSDELYKPNGAIKNKITINYGSNYRISYKYDEEENLYRRFINNEAMKDNDTEEEIRVTNIIIERVGIKVIDSVGRLELYNIGKNRGYLCTAGRLIEIEWHKDSRTGKTVYKDLYGSEIKINTGVTWIQVVSERTSVDFEEDLNDQGLIDRKS